MTNTEQRARDAEIASRIMGWSNVKYFAAGIHDWCGFAPNEQWSENIPAYHTDETASAALRDRLAQLIGENFQIRWVDSLGYWLVDTDGANRNDYIVAEDVSYKTALALFAKAWIERNKT